MNPLASFRGRLAYLHHVRGNTQKAKVLYEKAYRGGFRSPAILSAYATLVLREGEFALALEVAQRAERCAKKPVQKGQPILNQGLALWKLGRLPEAIALYEKWFADLRSGSLYGSLGYFYIEEGDASGDYAKALRFNLEALEYDEDDAIILDNVAQTYLRMGHLDEAEAYYLKALAKKETQHDSLAGMGQCLLHKGDTRGAKEYFARALERPYSYLNTVDRAHVQELYDSIS